AAAALDTTTGGTLKRALEGGRFTGGKGQTLDLVAPSNLDAGRVTLTGAGRIGEMTAEAMESAAAQAFQAVKTSGSEILALRLPGVSPDLAAAAAFGI